MVNLNQNGNVSLPEVLSGNKVVFTSSVLDIAKPSSFDSTTLALLNHDGDTVLAIGVRRYTDCIVLNTQKKGGNWDADVVCPNLERAFGPNTSAATVMVQDADDEYKVFCNDNYLCTFAKRYQGDAVKAYYAINSGQDSAYSNPVTVEVKD